MTVRRGFQLRPRTFPEEVSVSCVCGESVTVRCTVSRSGEVQEPSLTARCECGAWQVLDMGWVQRQIDQQHQRAEGY